MAGEVFDQKRGLNTQEERDFLKKGDIDKIKQEVGGDIKKLENTIIKNYHSENYDNISNDKINQIKNVVGKDFYDKNYKLKAGGSQGIAALQILAIKCVGILNQVSVEQILKTKYINSWSVDGILGPNTLYMLKEISKTNLGGPAIAEWNGIINQELLNKMLNICGEKEEKKEEKKEEPKKEEPKQEETKQEGNDSGLEEKKDVVGGLNNNGSTSEDHFRQKAQELEQKINDVMKPSLKGQFDDLAIKHSIDGYFFDKNIKKSLNGEKEFYSVIKNGVVVMDIGIFVGGADKGKMYIGLEDFIYQKSNVGQELNFNAFDKKPEDTKSGFENIIDKIETTKEAGTENKDKADLDKSIEELKIFINSQEISDLFKSFYKNENISQVKKDEIETTWRTGLKMEFNSLNNRIKGFPVNGEKKDNLINNMDVLKIKINTFVENLKSELKNAKEVAEKGKLESIYIAGNVIYIPNLNRYQTNDGKFEITLGTPYKGTTLIKDIRGADILYTPKDGWSIRQKDGSQKIDNYQKQIINFIVTVHNFPSPFFNADGSEIIKQVEKIEFTLQNLKNGLKENTFAAYGLTYEVIFNKINAIKNQEVKDKVCEYLLKSDIKGMQEYVGMKQGSKYKDNNADGNFGKITLDRISNPLFGLKGNDIESSGEIAGDVKSKYKEFLERNLNLGLGFAIISKSDFNMYVFSADHKLISVHPVLLGKDKGDQANTAYIKDNRVKTTPGGMYYIPEDINNLGNKAAKLAPDKYAYPGEYVALYPEEGQYAVSNPDDFTLGFHNYYLGKNRDGVRENLFWEPDLNKRRISSGCINTLSQGSIYDNLIWKSKVYITKESN